MIPPKAVPNKTARTRCNIDLLRQKLATMRRASWAKARDCNDVNRKREDDALDDQVASEQLSAWRSDLTVGVRADSQAKQ